MTDNAFKDRQGKRAYERAYYEANKDYRRYYTDYAAAKRFIRKASPDNLEVLRNLLVEASQEKPKAKPIARGVRGDTLG